MQFSQSFDKTPADYQEEGNDQLEKNKINKYAVESGEQADERSVIIMEDNSSVKSSNYTSIDLNILFKKYDLFSKFVLSKNAAKSKMKINLHQRAFQEFLDLASIKLCKYQKQFKYAFLVNGDPIIELGKIPTDCKLILVSENSEFKGFSYGNESDLHQKEIEENSKKRKEHFQQIQENWMKEHWTNWIKSTDKINSQNKFSTLLQLSPLISSQDLKVLFKDEGKQVSKENISKNQLSLKLNLSSRLNTQKEEYYEDELNQTVGHLYFSSNLKPEDTINNNQFPNKTERPQEENEHVPHISSKRINKQQDENTEEANDTETPLFPSLTVRETAPKSKPNQHENQTLTQTKSKKKSKSKPKPKPISSNIFITNTLCVSKHQKHGSLPPQDLASKLGIFTSSPKRPHHTLKSPKKPHSLLSILNLSHRLHQNPALLTKPQIPILPKTQRPPHQPSLPHTSHTSHSIHKPIHNPNPESTSKHNHFPPPPESILKNRRSLKHATPFTPFTPRTGQMGSRAAYFRSDTSGGGNNREGDKSRNASRCPYASLSRMDMEISHDEHSRHFYNQQTTLLNTFNISPTHFYTLRSEFFSLRSISNMNSNLGFASTPRNIPLNDTNKVFQISKFYCV